MSRIQNTAAAIGIAAVTSVSAFFQSCSTPRTASGTQVTALDTARYNAFKSKMGIEGPYAFIFKFKNLTNPQVVNILYQQMIKDSAYGFDIMKHKNKSIIDTAILQTLRSIPDKSPKYLPEVTATVRKMVEANWNSFVSTADEVDAFFKQYSAELADSSYKAQTIDTMAARLDAYKKYIDEKVKVNNEFKANKITYTQSVEQLKKIDKNIDTLKQTIRADLLHHENIIRMAGNRMLVFKPSDPKATYVQLGGDMLNLNDIQGDLPQRIIELAFERKLQYKLNLPKELLPPGLQK